MDIAMLQNHKAVRVALTATAISRACGDRIDEISFIYILKEYYAKVSREREIHQRWIKAMDIVEAEHDTDSNTAH